MSESVSLPKPKRIAVLKGFIVFLRVVVAAFLGIELAVEIAAAFNLDDWLLGALSLAGMALCVKYARHQLLLLFALTFILYFVGLAHSRNKISGFCSSITATTPSSELTNLAERANVKLRIHPIPNEPGKFYGRVCDPFSMCDFVCALEFDNIHVTSSRIFNH